MNNNHEGWKESIFLNTARSPFLQLTIYMIFRISMFSMHMECKENVAQMTAKCFKNKICREKEQN